MKTEILIAIITGSISLFGVIITTWLNYKVKLLEIQMKSDKLLPKKRRKNTIWFIIFGIILLGSGIYFLIQQNNTSSSDIVWETDSKGYFIDQRDQQKYKFTKFGGQVWMTYNLNYNTIGALSNPEFYNKKKYGKLNSWETANNISPIGWHLPTDNEWTEFTSFLNENNNGGRQLNNNFFYIVNDDTLYFPIINTGGFNGKNFDNFGNNASFWSATETNELRHITGLLQKIIYPDTKQLIF